MEQQKHDVYSSARLEFPELIDNREFRSVKNMIINTVLQMDLNDVKRNTEMEFEKDMLLADTVCRLFANIGNIIADDYNKKFQSGRKSIDHKLKMMIQQKKQALGIKTDNSQKIY